MKSTSDEAFQVLLNLPSLKEHSPSASFDEISLSLFAHFLIHLFSVLLMVSGDRVASCIRSAGGRNKLSDESKYINTME